MLPKEQNDLLTRTGPGTPIGELMRRYWIPALLAAEIPLACGREGPSSRARITVCLGGQGCPLATIRAAGGI